MNATLLALLNDGARFDAEFHGGLSNHLPMALLALQRLGASPARLSAYAKSYQTRLAPAPPPTKWPAGEPWRERLGQREAWPAYRQFFAEWLQVEEGSSVLSQALPYLIPGCGGAAFHGLIRCAYAVHSAHIAELADALAYWACRYLPLNMAAVAPPPAMALDEALAGVPRVASSARLIFEHMQAVAAQPGFAPAVSRLLIDEHTLPTLAQHAAALYARSGNFVVLHQLTSAHALRTLLPFIEEPETALRDYWCAYAAAHAASDALPRDIPPSLPWSIIVERAIGDDDEHVIKLVDSCREEERVYGGEVWRQAATCAVTPSLTKT